MSTETLTCEQCGQDWQRERKRGRKPKTCPGCVGGVAEPTHEQRVFEQPQEDEEPQNGTPKIPGTDFPITPGYGGSKSKEEVLARNPKYTTWWCDQQVPMHKTCKEYGKGRGVPCTCPCHDELEI